MGNLRMQINQGRQNIPSSEKSKLHYLGEVNITGKDEISTRQTIKNKVLLGVIAL